MFSSAGSRSSSTACPFQRAVTVSGSGRKKSRERRGPKGRACARREKVFGRFTGRAGWRPLRPQQADSGVCGLSAARAFVPASALVVKPACGRQACERPRLLLGCPGAESRNGGGEHGPESDGSGGGFERELRQGGPERRGRSRQDPARPEMGAGGGARDGARRQENHPVPRQRAHLLRRRALTPLPVVIPRAAGRTPRHCFPKPPKYFVQKRS